MKHVCLITVISRVTILFGMLYCPVMSFLCYMYVLCSLDIICACKLDTAFLTEMALLAWDSIYSAAILTTTAV